MTVLPGPVKRRFSVPVFDRIVVVRGLGQGWPQAIAEGDARRPGRGRARRQPDRGRGASAQPECGRKREAGVWQRRYREHTIRDDDDYAAHMDYIHFNPVKHGVAPASRRLVRGTGHVSGRPDGRGR